MGGRRYLVSWILMLLFLVSSVPVLSGCDQLGGSDASKSSDEDEDDDEKKKKKKKDDDEEDEEEEEEEEEEEDDGGKKKKKKKDDDDDGEEQADNDDGDKPTEIPPAPAPPPTPLPVVDPAPKNLLKGAVYKRIRSTNVEVPVPAGWKEFSKGLYTGFTSPDGKVAIAFTTVTYKGEVTGRIQDIEKKLGITNDKITKQTDAKIGPNKLTAHIVDATCNFHGKPGKLAYVIVQQKGGKRTLVLVIYASENGANKQDDETAHAAILNLR